jgi:hypothetical protein
MESRTSGPSLPVDSESRHQCLIYEGAPSGQLPALAAMVKRKLGENHRCAYLNSRPMVAGMRSCLSGMGIDIGHEVSRGRLVLSSEPVGPWGRFDEDVMLQKLEGDLDQALKDGYDGFWVTGDMTWEFGHESNFVKLMNYEHRLEELMQRRPELGGICQYHRDTLPADVPDKALLTHRTVFVNATLSYVNSKYVPVRAVV